MKKFRCAGLLRRCVFLLGLAALEGCAADHGPKLDWPDHLVGTSERTGYQGTETHAEVVDLMDRLAQASPLITRATLGRSLNGRELPLMIIADPPVTSAAEAAESGKLVVYLQACIHGGEVCGKPALLQLARELTLDPQSPDASLLSDLILVMCPVYNADGNDDMRPGNRGGAQKDPVLGMGTRANAQGLDLNRDHMKLDSPEARAHAAFLTEWNPHLTLDLHTTNGSLHQYALTYAAPQNPSGHPAPIEFVRDRMLPAVTRSLQARTGLKTFLYGNFDENHSVWATYSHQPRFGAPYRGLRNRMSILSEAYAYDTYEQRVTSTREFVRECLRYAATHRDEILAILERAERDTLSASAGDDGDDVAIRYEIAAYDQPIIIHGLAPAPEHGERALRAKDFIVDHYGRYIPTLAVKRPYAYLIPPECGDIVEKLRQHGIEVAPLGEPSIDDFEVYTIDSVSRSDRAYQGRHLVTVEATPRRVTRALLPATPTAEWWMAPTHQPLGNLLIYLLEPESDDGLTQWGLCDEWISSGDAFPIFRVMSPISAR